MTEREKLLNEVLAFLDKAKMDPTRFSIEAAGYRAFMTGLKRGAGVHIDTAGKVRQFMKDWRPERPKSRAHLQPAA